MALGVTVPQEDVLGVIEDCLQLEAKKRPTMKKVVEIFARKYFKRWLKSYFGHTRVLCIINYIKIYYILKNLVLKNRSVNFDLSFTFIH